jgi:hypothetical protein
MSELNQEASGSNVTSSAVTESNELDTSSAVDDSKTKHIDKLLKEKQNAMKGLNHVKSENDILKEKLKEYEEKELLSTQQHEKFIELQKTEISELKSKLDNYQTRELEGKKSLAILGELKKLGFVENDSNKEIAMKLLDRTNVEIDPNSNVVLGADMAAKLFYDKYNSLGIFGKASVKTSNQSVNYTGAIKEKSVSEMNDNEKKIRLKESLSNLIGG